MGEICQKFRFLVILKMHIVRCEIDSYTAVRSDRSGLKQTELKSFTIGCNALLWLLGGTVGPREYRLRTFLWLLRFFLRR